MQDVTGAECEVGLRVLHWAHQEEGGGPLSCSKFVGTLEVPGR